MKNLEKTAFILLLFHFLLFPFLSFPRYHDEIIYINMAKSIGKNIFPYIDFLYTHPPIQLLLLLLPALTQNLFVVKFVVFIFSLISVYLCYKIFSKISNKRSALISVNLFLISLPFFVYNKLAAGMFECLMLFLLGFYFLTRKKLYLSSLFLMLSFYTRYLTILLFPFLFLNKNKKHVKKVLLLFSILSSIFFLVFIIIFGKNYLIHTMFYHLNVNVRKTFPNFHFLLNSQIIYTLILVAFLNLFVVSKNKKADFLFLYAFLYYFLLVFLFKDVILRYWYLTYPFVCFLCSKIITSQKTYFPTIFVLLTFLLNIIANVKEFFPNEYDKLLIQFTEYKNYTLFGDPYITNYLSFSYNSKIVNNTFDINIRTLEYLGKDYLLNVIKKEKPEVVFDVWNLNLTKIDERYKIKSENRVKCFLLRVWIHNLKS